MSAGVSVCRSSAVSDGRDGLSAVSNLGVADGGHRGHMSVGGGGGSGVGGGRVVVVVKGGGTRVWWYRSVVMVKGGGTGVWCRSMGVAEGVATRSRGNEGRERRGFGGAEMMLVVLLW